MKLLLVGDVHATVDELPECERLLGQIDGIVDDEHPDAVVFLGDQYNDHAVVRVEVMDFWNRWSTQLLKSCQVIMLLGNHDRPGDASAQGNALSPHLSQGVDVINYPGAWQGIMYAPYAHNHADFANNINREAVIYKPKTLICHQTFDGSKYENGFFASDGIDADTLNVECVISGHIHTPQTIGKVEYIGAPRWRTMSDANVDRHLHLIEFKDGLPVRRKLFSTALTCTPIEKVTVSPDEPWSGVWKWNNSVRHVTVEGPLEFIATQKALFAAQTNVRLRTVPATKQVVVRESEGIQPALTRFLTGFVGKYATPPDQLLKMVQSRYV